MSEMTVGEAAKFLGLHTQSVYVALQLLENESRWLMFGFADGEIDGREIRIRFDPLQ